MKSKLKGYRYRQITISSEKPSGPFQPKRVVKVKTLRAMRAMSGGNLVEKTRTHISIFSLARLGNLLRGQEDLEIIFQDGEVILDLFLGTGQKIYTKQ